MAQTVNLGPLVRLEGISQTGLPPGGRGNAPSNPASADEKLSDGSGATSSPLDIPTFVKNVLSEAIPFIDGVAPKFGGTVTWKSKGTPKTFTASEAPVHLYELTIPGRTLDGIEGMSQSTANRKDETWFCRRSVHQNRAQKGSADWDEFTRSFKDHHAETEDAFTPTVIGHREAIVWDTSGLEIEAAGGTWTNISLVVEEMKHKIPPPLNNRTFPVLILAASLKETDEFIVVSIPVNDFVKSPYAEFARDKSLVVAAYAAVERIRILPSNGDIEWIMATASDAGGVLPQWMQNMAVPGAVAKDVEMFMTWISSQRKTVPSQT